MSSQSRIRVFAGPNGSGKTSLYSVVSKTYNSGIFINADEIEKILQDKEDMITNNPIATYFKKNESPNLTALLQKVKTRKPRE